ncbi:hypothetical protein [Desulfonatronum sp. SC1]|uniref:hypothetical protein n=1 Tax=Desulfonatronum sp. SC1 TaxID=2109626 RepID=UPI000D2FB6D0|nr:hypothetical protein [Desulfonatronum sp. SC1]PTN31897.1 hypothetical protein C6366_17445 [Desulfonatronum sp. SC1]
MNDIKMTEPIQRAVAWIDETRRDHPERSLVSLLAEAGMRFNLGPNDGRFLERFFQSGGSSEIREESESP